MVQQHSQVFGPTKLKNIPTLLELSLKSLHRLSHHISVSKDSQNWWRLKPRKGAALIENMTVMKVALSKTKPSISQIVSKKQQQRKC